MKKNHGYNPHGQDQELPRMYKKAEVLKLLAFLALVNILESFQRTKKYQQVVKHEKGYFPASILLSCTTKE